MSSSPRSNRNDIETLKRKNEHLEGVIEQLRNKTARLSDDSGQYYAAEHSRIHAKNGDKNTLRSMPKVRKKSTTLINGLEYS